MDRIIHSRETLTVVADCRPGPASSGTERSTHAATSPHHLRSINGIDRQPRHRGTGRPGRRAVPTRPLRLVPMPNIEDPLLPRRSIGVRRACSAPGCRRGCNLPTSRSFGGRMVSVAFVAARTGSDSSPTRRKHVCRDCGYQFRVTAGTALHHSHVRATSGCSLCSSRSGQRTSFPVNRLHGVISGSYKTSWSSNIESAPLSCRPCSTTTDGRVRERVNFRRDGTDWQRTRLGAPDSPDSGGCGWRPPLSKQVALSDISSQRRSPSGSSG